MLLSYSPPLGGSGPEGHFLATALPHGLLCRQLLGTVDGEPQTGPALPGPSPACPGEGRQGLKGAGNGPSWARAALTLAAP